MQDEDREAEVEDKAADDESDDEFADAFEDATVDPVNPVENAEPKIRDDDAQNDPYTERTFAIEKRETFTIVNPPEDEMTMEQMKEKLEFYRLGARRSPRHYLQKFCRPQR